jgi:hypothetical protein
MELLLPLAQALQVQRRYQFVMRLPLLPVAGVVALVLPAAVVCSLKPKWPHTAPRQTVTLSLKEKCTT